MNYPESLKGKHGSNLKATPMAWDAYKSSAPAPVTGTHKSKVGLTENEATPPAVSMRPKSKVGL